MKKWGKGKVKRSIGTGAGIIFKGSGFYITDYRSEGYKAAAKKDSTAASPTAPATESKAAATDKGTTPAKPIESKPVETKTAAKPAKKAGKKR